LYVLAESKDRVNKERAMRRRQLKGLVKRLKELAGMELTRDQLLLKLGAAKNQYPAAWRLVRVEVPDQEAILRRPTFTFALRRDKLRQVRRREGRYLLRSNLSAQAPEKLWQFYIQLTQVEAAFKDLKDDLSLRPIFHSSEQRIEAHIFVSFLAYCLHVSLRACLRSLAPGLTPRSLLEKFAAIQGGRTFSHQRRKGTGVLPLYPTGAGPQDNLGATGLGSAATIPAADHPERPRLFHLGRGEEGRTGLV
jgi:transposase